METFGTYRHYMGVLFDQGERWKLVVSVLCSIGIALLDTLSVVLVAPLTTAMGSSWDTGLAGRVADLLGLTTQTSLVAMLLGVVVGGFVLKDVCTMVFTWWSLGFTASTRAKAQLQITEYYMRLPYYHHAQLGLPIILRKTQTATAQAYSAFASSIIGLSSQSFSIVLIVLALVVSAPVMTLTLLVFLLVFSLLFMRVIRPVNERVGKESMETFEQRYRLTIDAFGAIKETQLRNSYGYFMGGISAPTLRDARIERISGFISALPKQSMEILFMLGLGVVFAVTSVSGLSSTFLSSIALLVAAAFRLLPTVSGLMGSLTNIRRAVPGTKEFVGSKLASLEPGAVPEARSSDGVETMPLGAALTIENVHFSYGPGQPEVLSGVDLIIPAGSTVAFVGASGAGKSTLLDLVMGLQTPTSGRLLAGGVDLQTNMLGWQKNIGVVPQEVFLTDETLAENIAFDQAREDIDEDRIRQVLEQADLLEFVQSQPNGIWTDFGSGGRRLSGGQRQRVGIARALYRDPAVLILDEATSALDNETEARVAETISRLGDEITVIIVAHRLSTVRDADVIAFLVDGQVDAAGRFEDLLVTSDGFRELAQLGDLGTAGVLGVADDEPIITS